MMSFLRKKCIKYGVFAVLLLIWATTVMNLAKSLCELVVYFLMTMTIYIGFSSLNKANKEIKLESKNFEKRREQEKNDVQKWLYIKTTLNDVKLKEILNEDSQKYDRNEFHSVRFRTILKYVSNKSSRLPSLSDLRVLTYTAEEAKNSIWTMQTAIAVLLISGILGTLAGVDYAINNENFNIEMLQPALFPSSIAVLFTIVLIISRGIYKRRVDEYVGRLDRHTLSFYFPIFQPSQKIPVQFREITQSLAIIGNNIEDVNNCISVLERVSEKLENVMKLVGATGESVLNWCNTINTNKQIVNFYSNMCLSIAEEHQRWIELYSQVCSNVYSMTSSMETTSSLLLEDEVVQMVNSVKPFTQQVANIINCAEQLPNDFVQDRISQSYKSTGIVYRNMREIEKFGASFGNSLANCVSQAKCSSEISAEIKDLYTIVKTETKGNEKSYRRYSQNISYSCDEIHLKMNIRSMDSDLEGMERSVLALKDLNARFKAEPVFYWYELVIIISLFGLLLWNIFLTF